MLFLMFGLVIYLFFSDLTSNITSIGTYDEQERLQFNQKGCFVFEIVTFIGSLEIFCTGFLQILFIKLLVCMTL